MKRYLMLVVLVAVLVAAALAVAKASPSAAQNSPKPDAYWGSLSPTGAYDGAD